MLKVATVLLNCYLVFVCAPSFAGSKQAINGTDGTFNTGNTWTGDFGKTRNSVWPNESIEILDRGSSMAFTITDRNRIIKVCNTTNAGHLALGRGINSDGNSRLIVTVASNGGSCLNIENWKDSSLELSLQ